LVGFLGNFGLAILVLTIIVKGAMFPVANKSYRTMNKLKELQPQLLAMRDQFKDDPLRMQKELAGFYQKQKVNPLSGCLTMLIQIPVFFSLYKVFFVTIEMRHQPFFGWIHDLSAPDPTTIFNLFGLIDWMPPAYFLFIPLHVGAWPIIMGFTMWLQLRMNPAPTDPAQKIVFSVFPYLFTFMLAAFPAGLVIYWAWSNILGILQQWAIRRYEPKTTAQ
jgi:YidC/Oxa1 family membrane protein insertase